jgi:hypothetical protein
MNGFLNARKRTFGDLGAELGNFIPAFVEIDIEMGRLNIFPVKFPVLNLILSKIRALGEYFPRQCCAQSERQ